MSAWPRAVASIGMTGFHFTTSAIPGISSPPKSGTALRDLMARMGHDSERAAMIYQHVARGADQPITNAIDAHVQGEQRKIDDDENRSAGILVPRANGTPMARKINNGSWRVGGQTPIPAVTWV